MSDYTYSKQGIGAVYPINAVADAWGHFEPLITPAQLRVRHLFGIPLVSFVPDPITGQRQVMTDPVLLDLIERSVALAEAECHIDIMPRQRRDKHAFDRQQFAALGYTMLPNKPVQSIEKFSVTPANNTAGGTNPNPAGDLYVVPPDWIETAYIHTGQINIVPLTVAFQYGGFFVPGNSPNGGAAFLSILGQNPWIPAYWQTEYTTGFPEGKLPQIINELIGVIAAVEALGLLATTNARNSSHSVGVDGLSQSISTPGPQIYQTRIDMLTAKKEMLVNKIRSMFGTKLFTGVI